MQGHNFFQETLPTFFIYSFGGCLGTVFENFKLFVIAYEKAKAYKHLK